MFRAPQSVMGAGLMLMGTGSLLVYLKSIPAYLWRKIVDATTLSITITDGTSAFNWCRWWMDQHPQLSRTRRIDLSTPCIKGELVERYSLAPGSHWMWYCGRPIMIFFNRKEDGGHQYEKRIESITIRTIGRNQKFIRDLVEEIKQANNKVFGEDTKLYFLQDDFWYSVFRELRPLSSVIIKPEIKSRLVEDIKRFRQSKTWYNSLGIPYHRGYLFYGKPGTGKTSLVTGLASEFKADIYFLQLNRLNDSTLAKALKEVQKNSFVVMEDVDCVMSGKRDLESEDKTDNPLKSLVGVSLSGLLNVLDGLQAPEGVMYFMTTNAPQKLDQALIRPGRIDMRVGFDDFEQAEVESLYRRFFPTNTTEQMLRDLSGIEGKTAAEYQEAFLRLSYPDTHNITVQATVVIQEAVTQ